MKKFLPFILAIFSVIVSCQGSHPTPEKETGSHAGDTLVFSFPQNYMGSLDTLAPENLKAITSYKDMMELFEQRNYTPDAWQAGIREVPRIYLTLVGPNWSSKSTNEIDVLQKKRIFFRGLAPMILKSNELILKDRKRLEGIRQKIAGNETLSDHDNVFIRKLSELYKLNSEEKGISPALLDELWERVDIIPPSLALAQAAEESGWGSSRFAAEGNAIYGQWTWGKDAIKPEQQRKQLGNYGIAAFESIQESVSAYMLNLNTHNAYAKLRKKRAELRTKGQKITGPVLAEQLTSYSERGQEYVDGLKSLIDYNRLTPADDAFLSDVAPIYLVPAQE